MKTGHKLTMLEDTGEVEDTGALVVAPTIVNDAMDISQAFSPQHNPLTGIRDSLNKIVVLLSRQTTREFPPAEGWMTSDEAASYLSLSRRAIRDGAVSGNLPAHKYPAGSIRGQWRFRRDELDKWLQKKPRESKQREVSIWK